MLTDGRTVGTKVAEVDELNGITALVVAIGLGVVVAMVGLAVVGIAVVVIVGVGLIEVPIPTHTLFLHVCPGRQALHSSPTAH